MQINKHKLSCHLAENGCRSGACRAAASQLSGPVQQIGLDVVCDRIFVVGSVMCKQRALTSIGCCGTLCRAPPALKLL